MLEVLDVVSAHRHRSYRASRMTDSQLADGYAHLASILAPHVDVLCAETLASAREGAIAARAAAATGACGCKKVVHT